jgi:hypothetical protein
LIAAALKRVEVADDDSVLWEIAYQAQNGNGFEALPQLIADSVNSGMPNAHTALAVAYHPSIGPSLDELQVESILKKPGNEPVLATLIVVFGMDEMLQNKNSLNLLLQRTNLDPKIRLGLLKKIAREKQWSQWFASNRELIEVLRRDKSNEVAQFVDSQEE